MTASDDDQLPTVAKQTVPMRTGRGLRVSVVTGRDAGLCVAVRGQKVVVGRSAPCELRLTDPAASSFHVELAADRSGILVRDLESLNGTLYQGARILSAVVPPGAVLQTGSSLVRVDLDTEYEAAGEEQVSFGELVGVSHVMRELFSLMARLARTELSLLLEGPTGTGKELAARAVHEASAHAAEPFVVLDCTAIPASLAESVLFGHEKGAFTGATERRPGVFEAAGEGTVFLDEVGELPNELQPKLLRVLDQRQVVRVGSSRPVPMHARIVSATWRDLRGRVNQKRFREDLYYRLAQARVAIPALAERPEDIPALADHFLRRLPTTTRCARAITAEALRDLCERDFPGNVRELRSTIERAAMLADGPAILPSDLAFERMLMGERSRATQGASSGDIEEEPSVSLPFFKEAKRTLIDEFERDYLERLLTRAGKNLSRASALAGIERHHLRDLLRKHGLWSSE